MNVRVEAHHLHSLKGGGVMLLVLGVMLMKGCASPKAASTRLIDTTPAEMSLRDIADLQSELAVTQRDLTVTLAAKKELDEDRKRIQIELGKAQSQIRNDEAEVDAAIIINGLAAGMERKIQYALAAFGAGIILLGGVVLWMSGFKGWRGAAIMGGTGAFIIVFAFKLPVLGEELKWALRIVGVVGGGLATVWIARGLWMKWQTDNQAGRQRAAAERKMLEAQVARADGREADAARLMAEAAALFASAAQLRLIGTSEYDRKRVEPSATAVKVSLQTPDNITMPLPEGKAREESR